MRNAIIIATPIYLSKKNNINGKQVKDTEAKNCGRALEPRHNEYNREERTGEKLKCKIIYDTMIDHSFVTSND
jgi:hypothetical protein